MLKRLAQPFDGAGGGGLGGGSEDEGQRHDEKGNGSAGSPRRRVGKRLLGEEQHEDAETFTTKLANLRQDIAARQDTSGDKFTIELDGQTLDNRGISGELILRRAERIKNCFGDDVRIGRFAGFDLFLQIAS